MKVEVSLIGDLENKVPKKIVIRGNEVIVVKIDDNIYSVSARCTHRGCDLANGQIEGHEIICRCHGARFDLATGEAKRLDVTSKPLIIYEVEISNNKVFLRLPD